MPLVSSFRRRFCCVAAALLASLAFSTQLAATSWSASASASASGRSSSQSAYIGEHYRVALPARARTRVVTTSPCQDVLFVGARGSGQSQDAGQDYAMGPEVATALTAMTTTRSVGYTDVAYPSQAVELLAVDRRAYFDGLQQGRTWTTTFLAQRAKRCPKERIVLAGYSQGAMVVHRAVQDLLASAPKIVARLDGLLLIGDGDRIWDDNTTSYPPLADADNGIGQAFAGESGASSTQLPVAMIGRAHEVCDAADPVCHYSSVRLAAGFDGHKHYTSSPLLLQAVDRVNVQVQHTGVLVQEWKTFNVQPGMAVYWPVPLFGAPDDEPELTLAPNAALPRGLSIQPGGIVTGTIEAPAPGTKAVTSTTFMARLRINGGSTTSAWVAVLMKWQYPKKLPATVTDCARTFCVQLAGNQVRTGQYDEWAPWELAPDAGLHCASDECFLLIRSTPAQRVLGVRPGLWEEDQLPTSVLLTSVSCAGDGVCGGFGLIRATSAPVVSIRRDGLWTVRSGIPFHDFADATCAVDGSCMFTASVDGFYDRDDVYQTSATTSRFVAGTPRPGGASNSSFAVTCGGLDTCFVVRNQSGGAYVSRWMSNAWGPLQLVTSAPGVSISELSCAGSTCWASLSNGQLASWDGGTTWNVVTIAPSITTAMRIRCFTDDYCQARRTFTRTTPDFAWSPSLGWQQS